MRASRTVLLGAAASAALLASAAFGFAQSPTPYSGENSPSGRVITVPPGAVVLVLPAGSLPAMAPEAATSFPDMPSPIAMIRQMDQEMDRMMAAMQQGFAAPGWGPAWLDPDHTVEAAMQGGPPPNGAVQGVVVTMVSNGHGTCTQRITYSGNGAAPVVHVASTGDGCGNATLPMQGTVPAAQPELRGPEPAAMPHLIETNSRTTHLPAKPLVYADAARQ